MPLPGGETKRRKPKGLQPPCHRCGDEAAEVCYRCARVLCDECLEFHYAIVSFGLPYDLSTEVPCGG